MHTLAFPNARGLLRQNVQRVDDLLTDQSHLAFRGTMSTNRYRYLHANVNFSTCEETRNAWPTDN